MDSLHQLITYLEFGTNLHIGVLLFGSFGGAKLDLPTDSRIHSSPICDYFKNQPRGFARCYRCRNAAVRKAMKGNAFGGCCIHGVYEYTHPLVFDGRVTGMIFVGNILSDRLSHVPSEIRDTLETGFDERRCREVAQLVEYYIQSAAHEETPLLRQRNELKSDDCPCLRFIYLFVRRYLVVLPTQTY